jgi:hypothetical protein
MTVGVLRSHETFQKEKVLKARGRVERDGLDMEDVLSVCHIEDWDDEVRGG